MKYKNTVVGTFVSRPNRFIANVVTEGATHICHVKNTGRCRELLVPGARVILEPSGNTNRKTQYDLIAVYKGNKLINMDSHAPNKVIGEWIEAGGCFDNVRLIRPEFTYGNSRFDFYIETENERIFAEVKGVTLEKEGVVTFPDAPTERGLRHLLELAKAAKEGYGAYIFFVIQMKDCKYFTPNRNTHPEFADTMRRVSHEGVKIFALSCDVTPDSMTVDRFVRVIL